MAAVKPSVILRMGSHAEKEYVEKTARFFDGMIMGANLIEATPGASASLIVKVCGEKVRVPLYIDPMTYAFGTYIDRASKTSRNDLDWIKSDQKRRGKVVHDYKRSYRKLAERLGGPFAVALERGEAITPGDFDDKGVMQAACSSVVEDQ